MKKKMIEIELVGVIKRVLPMPKDFDINNFVLVKDFEHEGEKLQWALPKSCITGVRII